MRWEEGSRWSEGGFKEAETSTSGVTWFTRSAPHAFAVLLQVPSFPFRHQPTRGCCLHSVTLNQLLVPVGCLRIDHSMGTGKAPKPFVNIFPITPACCLLPRMSSHPAELRLAPILFALVQILGSIVHAELVVLWIPWGDNHCLVPRS